jgi:hypothetical protein
MNAKPELDKDASVTPLERAGRPSVPLVPQTKGELVVIGPLAPTLEQLSPTGLPQSPRKHSC